MSTQSLQASQPHSLPLVSQPLPGIGEYTLPEGQSFSELVSTKKAHYLAIFTLLGLIAAGITAIFFIPSILLPLAAIISLQIAAYLAITYVATKYIFRWMGVDKLCPPTQNLPTHPSKLGCPQVGEWARGSQRITTLQNSQNSNRIKLEMIKEAKHSIVMSGCYCGGEIFSKALKVIEEKLKAGTLKEVRIISSNVFLDDESKAILDRLNRTYPEVFHGIVNMEVFPFTNQNGKHFMFSGNHIKGLVVDGVNAMVGGSGMVDNWAHEYDPETAGASMLPQNFHDSDYVIQGESAKTIYSQVYALYTNMARRFGDKVASNASFPSSRISIPSTTQFDVEAVRVITTSPVQEIPVYENTFIEMVKSAKKTIFISQMYFHLTTKMREALEEALDKGKKVEVYSGGLPDGAPLPHHTYIALNRLNYKSLAGWKNFHVWENEQRGMTWHHKVVAIDGNELLFGSHNIGERSRESDDELSVQVKSESFTQQTITEIKAQAKLGSVKIARDKLKNPGFGTEVAGSLQTFLTPLL